MKRCSKCRRELPESEFWRSGGVRDRLQAYCKDCGREHARERMRQPHIAERSRERHRNKSDAERAKDVLRYQRRDVEIRHAALVQYSGTDPARCQCCGLAEEVVLQIDHVNGGGNAHRREIFPGQRHGGAFHRWLKSHGWPADPPLRVLCANCHVAITRLGHCPLHDQPLPDE